MAMPRQTRRTRQTMAVVPSSQPRHWWLRVSRWKHRRRRLTADWLSWRTRQFPSAPLQYCRPEPSAHSISHSIVPHANYVCRHAPTACFDPPRSFHGSCSRRCHTNGDIAVRNAPAVRTCVRPTPYGRSQPNKSHPQGSDMRCGSRKTAYPSPTGWNAATAHATVLRGPYRWWQRMPPTKTHRRFPWSTRRDVSVAEHARTSVRLVLSVPYTLKDMRDIVNINIA